jgi:hypothetical protein
MRDMWEGLKLVTMPLVAVLLVAGAIYTQFTIEEVHAQPSGTDIVTVRAASGALTAGETTTAISTGGYRQGSLTLDVTTCTTADGDDEVDFYVQISYGDGWTDAENVHLDNSDNGSTPTYVLVFGIADVASTDTATAFTDGTLADGTKVRIPLGAQLRIKTAVTGATAPTYAYDATIYLNH